MNIRLPEKFVYTSPTGRAYVDRGILYVEGNVNYEQLIYEIVYELKGRTRCCYCGEILSPKTRTIDHMYPRSWGGISIPENLLPCCQKCNLEKRDMTYKQFQDWRKIKSSKEQDEFFNKCISENYEFTKEGRFLLPSKWISIYDVSEIAKYISFKYLDKDKYKKLEKFFDKTHRYKNPIIVSANGWLFKGKHILKHAKLHNKRRIPAVVLDNVIVIRNSH